ncbi:ketopantoate reductase family protein [Promethearchaeum syntrophicum]|uniref:2-dehydropantoate 2-reductase n=1 Tax=Promethearchaeum syntrophicum TaxID=2594042 RepID=A0A5B9D6Y9_9ARCH|nr:ketopantoate reductase family protein [Candidatus Prometheoarchaeum syntrophicum]QEE14765.1 2-dehydropantoate 2-reductase [Candidatus Prometheoarchaeum syntrophicum]
MRILLIGPGSIGVLFGGKLALAGNRILIYARPHFSTILKEHPLKLTDIINKEHVVPNFEKAPPIPELIKLSPQEFPKICLITTKSYDLESVCREYQPVLNKIPIIGLIQNGIGNEEIIENNYPNSIIFRIITSHGAMRENISHIIHTGIGNTSICQIKPPYENISAENKQIIKEFTDNLQYAGFELKLNKNPLEAIWRKALTNIGINAIGALTQLTNGELLKSESLLNLIRKTINEAILIANKLQIPLDPSFDYVQNTLEVLKNTATNKNSMLQDVLRKKKTEIEFLNEKIVNYGKKMHIPTPINKTLSQLIHGLENSYIL